MKRFLFMAGLAGLMMFTACSSDENAATTDNKIEVTDGQFIFSTEDFGTDEGITRASAAPAKPQTVDLGDGIEAEVSVEQDAPAAQTRATQPISDGHYTIYAVDNATGTRVTGANSKLSGTVSGGKFIRDAGTRLLLPPGTYTFVCFNDAVTDNGSTLTVANGQDALIGTTTETISGTHWTVNFTMKHQTARIRFNIVSYTNEGTGITASLASGNTYDATHSYNMDASSSTVATTAAIAASQTFPTGGTVVNSPIVQTYNNATAYNYLLPGVAVNDLTLNFTAGTIYGKTLAGKAIALTNATKTLARNGSYTINVKLKPFAYFLFEDGTVGAMGDKGSRTPIGVVVKEKTATEQGIAAALHAITSRKWKNIDDGGTVAVNATTYTSVNDAENDMSGYAWTYNVGLDGYIKANESTIYPAFYAAAHYTPGVAVTGANVGNWFLPSYGQLLMFVRLFDPSYTNPPGIGTELGYYPMSSNVPQRYAQYAELIGYTNTSGTPGYQFYNTDFRNFLISSTQVLSGNNRNDPFVNFNSIDSYHSGSAVNLFTGLAWNTMSNSDVLPFVLF